MTGDILFKFWLVGAPVDVAFVGILCWDVSGAGWWRDKASNIDYWKVPQLISVMVS